jgi:hypothetical protein
VTGEGYVLRSGLATGIEADLVIEVAGVLGYYGCDLGPLDADVAAHAILAARSWRERKAAEERRHATARELSARETREILELAEARRRTVRRTADEALSDAMMRIQGGRR